MTNNINNINNKHQTSKIKKNSNIFYNIKRINLLIALLVLINAIVLYLLLAYSTKQFWLKILQELPGSHRDPDLGSNIFQLIKSRGFDFESHFISTSDGYTLQMVRLVNPFVKNQTQYKPLLLFHGFSCSGSIFLVNNPGTLDEYGNYVEYDENQNVINNTQRVPNTLGFVLASYGYDVWLANGRGSIYSLSHTTYKFDNREYWKFSLDEMIQIDLHVMIDYILDQTKHSTLGYIGHSQGNILMLALMSISDHYQQRVKPFVALSPSWYLFKSRLPLKALSSIRSIQSYIRSNPGYYPFYDMATFRILLGNLCSNKFIQPLCRKLYVSIGFDSTNIRNDRLGVYLYHSGIGLSSWNLLPYIEIIQSKKPLKFFDYGPKENQKLYGQKEPPEYDISKINSTDLALYYSYMDHIDTIESNMALKKNLKVKLRDEYIIEDKWDHMSFVWGTNVGKLNARILSLLSTYY